DNKRIRIWGRIVLVPGVIKQGKDLHGVAVVMYGTSAAPEIRSLEDVGTKGELPRILKSFRFEPSAVSNRFVAPSAFLSKMEIGTDTVKIDDEHYMVDAKQEFSV